MNATLAAGALLGLALLLPAAPASAALSASDLALDGPVLNQFNAIAFGDYTAGNETEGRIAVGGNFAGGGHNICFNGCGGDTTATALGATYGSLTVWGNVTGLGAASGGGDFFIQGGNAAGSTLNMNYNGGVSLAGQNSGTIQGATFVRTSAANAGNTQNLRPATPINTGVPTSTSFPFAATMPFEGALRDLATGIATDAAATTAQTLGAYVQNGPTQITATAAPGSYGGKRYGFITTTAADLASYQNFFGVNTNGLDAVFVVVTGQPGAALPTLNSNNNETNVIWDFVDATTLTFSGSWYGQILAPNATVTNNGDLNGAVIAEAIDQKAEIHQYTLSADALGGLPVTSSISGQSGSSAVPEPSTVTVLAVGVLGIGLLRRQARRA
jgi:choice-of-anchor A domain-containing protein